jgi:hypothetical protein
MDNPCDLSYFSYAFDKPLDDYLPENVKNSIGSENDYYAAWLNQIFGKPVQIFWDLDSCAIVSNLNLSEVLTKLKALPKGCLFLNCLGLSTSSLVSTSLQLSEIKEFQFELVQKSIEINIYTHLVSMLSQKNNHFPGLIIVTGNLNLLQQILTWQHQFPVFKNVLLILPEAQLNKLKEKNLKGVPLFFYWENFFYVRAKSHDSKISSPGLFFVLCFVFCVLFFVFCVLFFVFCFVFLFCVFVLCFCFVCCVFFLFI